MSLPTAAPGRRYRPSTLPTSSPQATLAVGGGWKTLIDSGRMVPFVGDSLVHPQLTPVSFSQLIRGWAEADEIGYPWPEQATPALVAQFIRMKESDFQARLRYLAFLKTHMFKKAEEEYFQSLEQNQAGPADVVSDVQLIKAREKIEDPRYSLTDLAYDLGCLEPNRTQDQPLHTLAGLNFSIYITTSYHRFLEVALFQAGKQPVSELYPWNPLIRFPSRSIFEQDPDYVPSIRRPLVYHLFGRDDLPESLVLSESDYLELLINLASEQRGTQVGNNTNSEGRLVMQGLPPAVSQALAQPGSAPLLLGYDLNEWDFRILFRGLILPKHQPHSGEGMIIVQLSRPVNHDESSVKASLEKYMHETSKLRIHWGDARECLKVIETAYKANQ